MQRVSTQLWIIIAISGVVFFTSLGGARLWDRDEPRNAGCALEMMNRGNLVVPIFNDELRPQKPALLYWLIISAYKIFGVGEFAARFWSAVLAMGTVLATYGIGRRLLNPSSAFYAAIVLSTSLMFIVAGRAATPDSLLVFCSTMAILFYVLGTFSARANPADAPTLRWNGYFFPQKTGYVIAMYSMLGLGVLAKGPVGLILPCAIVGMFMLIQRLPPLDNEVWNSRGWLARLTVAMVRPFHPKHFMQTLWRMRPLTGAVVVLLIAAPWYIMVGVQTNGDWTSKFFLSENFARATSTFENHSGGFWYYPLAIALGFFPWSVFIAPVMIGVDRQMTRKHHWSMTYTFLLCWVGVQVGLFSLAQTKLPSYITPCYPALALLTGTFLSQLAAGKTVAAEALNRMSFVTLVVGGLLLSLGLLITARLFLASDYLVVLLGLIPVVGGGTALWFYANEQSQKAVTACCSAAVLLAVSMFGFGTIAIDQHRQSDQILNRLAGDEGNVPVGTFGCLESSWVFYAQQPLFELTSEPRSGSWSDERQNDWDRKAWPSPEQFVTANPDALIITTDQDLDRIKSRLPDDYEIIERAPYFLRSKELVLLGRVTDDATAGKEHTAASGQPENETR